jgi:hypothetical protein
MDDALSTLTGEAEPPRLWATRPPPRCSEHRALPDGQRPYTRACERRSRHRAWSRAGLGARHCRQSDHRCPLCTRGWARARCSPWLALGTALGVVGSPRRLQNLTRWQGARLEMQAGGVLAGDATQVIAVSSEPVFGNVPRASRQPRRGLSQDEHWHLSQPSRAKDTAARRLGKPWGRYRAWRGERERRRRGRAHPRADQVLPRGAALRL